MAGRLGVVLGIVLSVGTATAGAADPVSVWEVVTTYRKQLDNGRLQLMSDGKTDKGIPWTFNRGTVDFGREGKASARAGGTFFKGNWVGGWHLNARVLMSNVTLATEPAAPFALPKSSGQSMIGSRPSAALKDSIADLWEFMAIVPGTNRFIRLTCDLTSNNLVLDGDRKIATYEFQKKAVVVKFVDPQFGRILFIEKQDNVLSGRTKPIKRKYWSIKFVRVQRQAVYRTTDNKYYILYTNNRVNSPRYTSDYYSTFNWYYYKQDGKRRLAFRSRETKLSAGGREINWNNQKMVLIAGRPPR